MASEPRVQEIPVARLTHDMAVYPRQETGMSHEHVADLCRKLELGADLDPIVVEARTYVIVDGWHRARAVERHAGPDAKIKAIAKKYASRGELFQDAARLNADRRALPLKKVDQRRIVLMLDEFGIKADDAVAYALHTTTDDVVRLRRDIAIVVKKPQSRVAKTVSGEPVPLKGPHLWLRANTITPDQARVNRSAPGVSYRLTVRQLIEALRYEMIDPTDEMLRERLEELTEELNRYLAHHKTAV